MLHKKSDKRCYISVCRFFGRVQTLIWERFFVCDCIASMKIKFQMDVKRHSRF